MSLESFHELGLSESALKTLKKKGYEVPTLIQSKTIPAILDGDKDIVGQAQTGTGKTAAFGLPLIELLEENAQYVQALILTPTRELAIQVAEEINSLKGNKKLDIVPIYGGQSINQQFRSLKKGVDIVVGTPGRIIDHLKRKKLKLDEISFLILDEADEMLNMGFLEEVTEILLQTNEDKRTFLFSATMPKEILDIAKKHMGEYDVHKANLKQLTVDQTEQIYFEVLELDKFEALCRIIDYENDFYGLIFCRTKVDVDRISNHLKQRSYDAEALHGDMSQNAREKILKKFKTRTNNILVATDVAARGIDVSNLSHVINYSLPNDPESYVHRIGRTGRAGKEGIAITFVTPYEYRKLKYIERKSKSEIKKANLPKITDIIDSKKTKIKEELQTIINSELKEEYILLASELLVNNNKENILAALLQMSFQDEFDKNKYANINENIVDNKGKTRLFIKKGKIDGFSVQKIKKLVKEKCHTKSENIRDILILDKFSFVTLPFHDAEVLLSYFKNEKSKRGPLIEKANKKKKK